MDTTVQNIIVFSSIGVLFILSIALLLYLYRSKKISADKLNKSENKIHTLQDELEKCNAKLATSELGYEGLFNFVTDSVYILDENGVFLHVNKGAEKMYGYKQEDIIGKTPEFLSAEGKNDMRETFEQLQRAFKGETVRFEFWGRRKNGEGFPKEIELNKGVYRDKDVVVAVARDITLRKNAEERITKFNECFLSFGINPLENIKQIVKLAGELFKADVALYNCIIDGEIRSIGKWNVPLDFIGADKPEGHICYDVIKSASDRIVVIPDLSETKYIHTDPDVIKYQLKSYIGVAVKAGNEVTGSLCVLFKDGFDMSEENKQFFYILAAAISIEEQRRISEEKLKKSSADLKELNITKDKFFSIISHDLKNPFNAILGFSTILSEDYNSLTDNEIKEFIVNIRESSASAYKLMDNLLIWTRAQTNRLSFNPEDMDLCIVALETIELLKPIAHSKDIVLRTNIPLNSIVFADKNMIETVIRNLISNGIKFTNPGGSVSISAVKYDDKINVIIADTGVGIHKDFIGKLFRIDQMYKTEGTKGESGTGLGLILCKEFVEKNNGKISIESEPEKGTKVIIELSKN